MFMKDFTRTVFAAPVFRPVPAATAPLSTGLVAGTLIEGAEGWQPIESLRLGDRVQTLDGGLATVLGLERTWMTPGSGTTLRLPGGALDNCTALALLPDQHVLVDVAGDPEYHDDLFVLIPAAALLGRLGTTRHQIGRPTEVITPLFREDEAVYANSGTLLHCPGVAAGAGKLPCDAFFPLLDVAAARGFLARRQARLAA